MSKLFVICFPVSMDFFDPIIKVVRIEMKTKPTAGSRINFQVGIEEYFGQTLFLKELFFFLEKSKIIIYIDH